MPMGNVTLSCRAGVLGPIRHTLLIHCDGHARIDHESWLCDTELVMVVPSAECALVSLQAAAMTLSKPMS